MTAWQHDSMAAWQQGSLAAWQRDHVVSCFAYFNNLHAKAKSYPSFADPIVPCFSKKFLLAIYPDDGIGNIINLLSGLNSQLSFLGH